jgi:hypothetical protein
LAQKIAELLGKIAAVVAAFLEPPEAAAAIERPAAALAWLALATVSIAHQG